MNMKGKTVLITGGGTGIGEACARRLAAEHAHVILMGRRAEVLQRVAESIGAATVVGDAAQAADVRRAVQLARTQFGGLDAVIASAGGFGMGSATATDDVAWQASLNANLTSAFVVARECLPALIDRRGAMVLVSSIAGLAAGPEVCGYTTTKHAMIGLAKSLARDYGPLGVRVNTICPGWVRTPMADDEMQVLMDKYNETLEKAYARVTADVPLRRAATAAEIASLCRFLISPESSIVTGAVLVADGGSTIVDVPTLAFTRD